MKFEAYLQSLHPELFKECANYLSHRGVMVHPKVFQKIGIMVFEGEQHPGYYTIIWPGVYHFGFNKGKNVAEVRFFKIVKIQISTHILYRQWLLHLNAGWITQSICRCVAVQTPLYHSMQPWMHKDTSRITFQTTIMVSGSHVQNMELAKGKFLSLN